MTQEKNCFVISPIGGEGTKTRIRANDILNYIIRPAAEEFDYNVIRADEISSPGMITRQIVKHLVNDSLVIGDCSGKNANVFYELAVRHAAKEPAIQMMKKKQDPPFDVKDMRTVMFSAETLGEAEKCKKDLRKQISAVEEGPKEESTNSPISSAIELSSLYESDTPEAKKFEKIISELERLNSRVAQIEQQSSVISGRTAEGVGGAVPASGESERFTWTEEKSIEAINSEESPFSNLGELNEDG